MKHPKTLSPSLTPAPAVPSRRLRLPDAAVFLGITRRTLASKGWRIKHRVPTIAIGRALVFDTGALDRWLAQHVVPSGDQGGSES
jgi:predicted DNA-binding transcriptional regulator AlpA